MEEKNIIITVENYKGQKIVYTMPANATVESMVEFDATTMTANRINIDARADEILIEKEDINSYFNTKTLE